MTPGVVTCTSCGSPARPGSRFCQSCAAPLTPEWAHKAAKINTPNAGIPGYTNAWDTVLPRLQEALYGEFVISQELGRGGMAAVFLAHQLRLNRKVAIKVMAPTLMSGLGLIDRFRDEATTVARLDHPNIISIYEVGETNGLQYFVMQHVAGRSLERAMRQYSQLPIDVVRGILFDVGGALAYAHRHQVIHRDVKPGNILLSLDGRVIVSDFGIAKVTASTARTQTGAVVGTPAYMSPEQCLGRPLTSSADQYSLGVVAYEMVTGAQPFAGSSFVVMRGHIEERPPSILERRSDCPRDVAAAIERMLSKNVADRFASMGEALGALGATRARISDAVQAAVGQLAIPLPEETGVVLVHTPASPAPQRTPANAMPRDPAPAKSALDDTVLLQAPAPTPAPSPQEPLPHTALSPWAAKRAFTDTIAPRLRSFAQWSAASVRRVGSTSRSVAQRAWTRVATALARARHSRVTLGVTGGTVIVAALVFTVVKLARNSGSSIPAKPAAVVAESALGSTATPPDSAPDSARARADSLPDSLATDAFVPQDSSAASSVHIIRRSTSVPTDARLQLSATVKDFRGNRISNADVRWSVADESAATIDSLSGWVKGKMAGKQTWVIARAGYGADSILLTFEKPPARTVAAAPEVETPTKPAEPPPPALDEALESKAVQATFDMLLDSIATKDTNYVNTYYWRSTDEDFVTRKALIDDLSRTQDLIVAPPQNPPQPTFTGTTLASMQTRIAFRWKKNKRSQEERLYAIHAEFRRTGAVWVVNRFRLTATK